MSNITDRYMHGIDTAFGDDSMMLHDIARMAAAVHVAMAAAMQHPEWAQAWLQQLTTLDADHVRECVADLLIALPITAEVSQ